jgi:hypothetical protein
VEKAQVAIKKAAIALKPTRRDIMLNPAIRRILWDAANLGLVPAAAQGFSDIAGNYVAALAVMGVCR